MQKTWLIIGKDKYGGIVKIVLSNPVDADEAKTHADMHHFGQMRRNAILAGQPDPELVTIEVQETGVAARDFGAFKPAGVTKLDLNKYVPKKSSKPETADEIELD